MTSNEAHHMAPARQNAKKRLACALLAIAAAIVPLRAEAAGQTTYKSAQEAVDALVAAVKAGELNGIVAVLGPDGRALASSGDPVADKAAREKFASAYDEAHQVKQDGDMRAELIIGKDDYPFPIPIVAKDGSWRFDTAAGAEEILNRRIGENELATVEVLRAYVDAQREYAQADRDGKGAQYARKLISSTGKQDGLYWPTEEGQPESPLGPLVANAKAEGYRKGQGPHPTPYHGYVFRILTAQGKDAPDGARDYIYNGRMIGGFGMVAAPAEYGNSGIMTFIVNQDGVVYEKDLGTATPAVAAKMTTFNSDSGWSKVE